MGKLNKVVRTLAAVALVVSLVPMAPAEARAAEVAPAQVAPEALAGTAEPLGAGALDRASAVWDGSVDTAWYVGNDGATEFTISTPAELAGLAAIVNGTARVNDTSTAIAQDDFAGKTVKLAADVKLNELNKTAQDDDQEKWTPIGNRALIGVHNVSQPLFDTPNYFRGTFDGQGHRVINIYACTAGETNKWNVNDYGGYQGLFGALGEGAVVRDVGLSGGYVTGRVAGGIAALGASASASKPPMILDCYSTATVEGDGSSSRGAGGIFGGEQGSEGDNAYVYIANCYNAGAVKGRSGNTSAPLGGIAGTGAVEAYSCYNAGTVASSSAYIRGAIVGNAQDGSVVADSYALEGSADALYNADDEPVYDGLLARAEMLSLVTDGKLSAAFTGTGVDFPKLFWESGLTPSDISAAASIAEVGPQDYTGHAVKPAIAVTYGASPLKAGSDYYVTFANNVNVGTAAFAVTFIGAYSGAAAGTFKISGTSLNGATVQVDAQWIYGTEDGGAVTWEAVEPEVTVIDATGRTLAEGTDYVATFSGNDAPGTGHVTVAPGSNGNYSGEKTVDFKIVAAPTSLAGAGTEDDPYLIGNRGDFQLVTHWVNDAVAHTDGKVFKMTADIDMAGDDENPAVDVFYAASRKVEDADSTEESPKYHYDYYSFAATLDGGGHELSMDFDVKGGYFGLFASNLEGTQTTVRDLVLSGSITTTATAAALFPSVYGSVTIEDVTSRVSVSGYQAYGFIGEIWPRSCDVVIRGCENQGAVNGGRNASGFVGSVHLDSSEDVAFEMTDCVNGASVTAGSDAYAGYWAAGFLGETPQFSSSCQLVKIDRCANTGAVAADGVAGGIIAKLGDSGNNLSTGDAARNHHSVTASFNAGTIAGGTVAGGLVGVLNDENRLEMANAYNTGAVSADAAKGTAGGLVGGIGNGGWFFNLSSAYNAGTVAAAEAGALLGYAGLQSMYYPKGAEITLSSAYYLEGTAPGWVGTLAPDEDDPALSFPRKGPQVTGEAVSRTASQMKARGASGMASALGSQFADDTSSQNKGYPVLYWQQGQVVHVSIAGGAVSAVLDQEYTGSPISPTGITVTLADGTVLNQGSDFTVTFTDNVNVGTATGTITGIGRFEGELPVTFKIVAATLAGYSIDDIAGQWGNASSPATPDFVLRNAKGYPVNVGDGFDVAWSNNDEAGMATVTVSPADGNTSLSGHLSQDFEVKALPTSLKGDGTQASPYQVKDAGDLEFAARGVNDGTLDAGAAFKLMASFDIPENTAMTSIGVSGGTAFAGTILGNGKAITRQDTQPNGYSLLGSVDGATVRDLTIAGKVMARHTYESDVFQGERHVHDGGTFARVIDGDATFSNCVNTAKVIAVETGRYSLEGLGGFAARVDADCTVVFENCRNEGSVGNASTDDMSASNGTGGFVGSFFPTTMSPSADSHLTFKGCVNAGAVCTSNASYAAGFVGKVDSDGYDQAAVVSLENCLNTGAISAPAGASQAGIVGGGTSGGDSDDPGTYPVTVKMRSVGNRGAVSGFDGSAGLFGVSSGISLDIDGAYNTGAVTIATDLASGTQIAGGLVTVATTSSTVSTSSVSIANAYNAGQLVCTDESETADPLFGGIIGGAVSGGDYSYDNVYYTVEGCDHGVGNASADEQTGYAIDPDGVAPAFADDLRDPAFVAELGSAFIADEDNENGGFPVFAASKADIGGYYVAFVDADALSPTELTVKHTGSALRPGVVVSPDATGLSTLVEGRDYVTFYRDNVDAGTASVTIVGTGAYRGTLVRTFEIRGAGSVADCSVTAIPEQVWTGGAIEPDFEVTYADGADSTTLVRGVDYTVTFSNNVNEGTAGALIEGTGAWTGSRVVKFGIWKPYLTVKLQTGNGAATTVKQYRKAELEALENGGDPVSALYQKGETGWNVSTAKTYVTLDALMTDAGVPWKPGVAVSYSDSEGQGKGATLTYDDLHSRYFYPMAENGSIDVTSEARPTPAVLALTEKSSTIGGSGTDARYAAEAEEYNLAHVSTANAPRFLLGITPDEAKAGTAKGARLINGVAELDVCVLDFSALSRAVTAANKAKSGVKTSSKSGADVYVNAKWVTPAAMTAFNKAIAAAKAVLASKTAVQADIDAAAAALASAQKAFKPVAGKKKLANTLTVKAKSASVPYSKAKASTVAASKLVTVSKAQGAVTYAKRSGNAGIAIAKNGKLTVRKGLAKATYSVKVRVMAAGRGNYASGYRDVVVKVRVR